MFLLCVACAVACAAFLDSVGTTDRFGPWEQDAFYYGLCRTEHTGYRTRKILNVPELLVESDGTDFTLLIPDLCKTEGLNHVGVVVTVCDPNSQPNLTLTSVAQGSVQYSQPSPNTEMTLVSCHIKEYCN